MLSEQVYYGGLTKPKGFYRLDISYERHFGNNPYIGVADKGKEIRSDISKVGDEEFEIEFLKYGALDVICAYKLYSLQKKRDHHNLLTSMFESEYALVVGDLEYNGVGINISKWLDLARWSKSKANAALEKLRSQYPEVENWNSHVQVKQLFKQLKIPIPKVKRKETVQADHIKGMADEFPVIKDYLEYKTYSKANSTYGEKFLNHISPITGRIHTNFLQIKNTGRMGSASPNLQNIVTEKSFPGGGKYREAFEAPDGYTFIVGDFSKQELHGAAFQSGDEAMITALREGQDLHRIAAAGLYHIPLEEVTDLQRHNGKTANFAIQYGATVYKLMETFGVSEQEAIIMLEGYFKMFPEIKKFQLKTFEFALEHGYIIADNYIKRKIWVDKYDKFLYYKQRKDGDRYSDRMYKTLGGEIFRMAANYPIQSWGATMTKLAGILMRREFQKIPEADAKIVLQVHDEYVVECKIEFIDQVYKIFESCMLQASRKLCPIMDVPSEFHITKYWSK